MLFYITYGCSISHEVLVIDAESVEEAENYAEGAAQESFYSYECKYLSDEDYPDCDEEELNELEYQEMLYDIDWTVVPFDKNNEEHIFVLEEQDNKPFSV